MTPRLKGTRTEIVRKNQLRPEIKFFPDGKIKTYFPFTLHSSSCPSIYLVYIHLYVYTYLYLCLHVGFFTPRESYDSNTAGRAGTEFAFPKTDCSRGLAELTGTWEASVTKTYHSDILHRHFFSFSNISWWQPLLLVQTIQNNTEQYFHFYPG